MKKSVDGKLVEMSIEEEKKFRDSQTLAFEQRKENREKKELLLNARKTSYDKLINLGFTKIESELLTKYVEPKPKEEEE
jgi:Holliday junction resolvasome RuvABC DNA-binding subunit